MTKFSLRLPARAKTKELLARLDPKDHIEFDSRLLHALWAAHESGSLPLDITMLLRGWLAHALFETSAEVQGRTATLRGLR